jgi:class 3 adenylate cyclase
MRMKEKERDIIGEPRYDAATLQKVAALAARLQNAQQETLTAREVEAIGAEVGLDAAFIRQALKMIAGGPTKGVRHRALAQLVTWSNVAVRLLMPIVVVFIYLYPHLEVHTLAVVLLTSAAVGLLTYALSQDDANRKLLAWWLGSFMAVGGFRLCADLWGTDERTAMLVVTFGIAPIVGFAARLMGVFRFQKRRSRSRAALLEQLFDLQRQLEGQKQHRAFLSIDVAGSSEMKRSAPELAVEHCFGQYRAWVEEAVRAHGGEMQSAAGDGVMAIFPTDAGAVRAARQLQEELPRFNAEQSRLPLPFRIRCGVSAGEVAMDEGTPLGHLQSPVIDRAAVLQKRAQPGDILVGGEVAGAALIELGALAPLTEPVAGEPAFSWRAGSPAISSG